MYVCVILSWFGQLVCFRSCLQILYEGVGCMQVFSPVGTSG